LQDLQTAIDLHDELIANMTPLQIGRGVQVVQNRMANGDVATVETIQ